MSSLHPASRPPTDLIRLNFLRAQWQAAQELQEQSDLLTLRPLPGPLEVPDRYLVTYFCKSLVRNAGGHIVEAARFDIGIWFDEDYLRRADARAVTLIRPRNTYHPNILHPAVCTGPIPAGTALVDLIYQVFDILVYRNWASHDGLNLHACQWARHHQHLFPVDPRPLKWKTRRRPATSSGRTAT